MKREDISIEADKIVVHPEKLKSVKQNARALITAANLGRLLDIVIDEELDVLGMELAIDEIADDLRIGVREALVHGLGL